MSTTRRILIASLITMTAGCTTVGRKFDPQRISELVPGVSTMSDSTELFGPPTSESTYADGSRLLQWSYVQGTVFGGSGAHVAVLFDKDGRMVRVTHRHEAP